MPKVVAYCGVVGATSRLYYPQRAIDENHISSILNNAYETEILSVFHF